MFKKISNLFCLFFLLIFVSCNNVFDNGEKTKDISFSLGEEVAAALVNRAGAGTEYTVNFTFDGIDREPYSVTVAKDKLGTTKFNIDNIPINKPFTISMKILDGGNDVYIGKSNIVTVTKAGSTVPVKIALNYPPYNFTEVPVKVGTKAIKIGSNPEKTYDIVEFGDWPQSVYSGDVNALKPCYEGINAWDKSVCFTDGNGGYYIKVKAKLYYEAGSNNDPSKPETNYKFSDGTTVKKDADYYFKLEPIQWRVLTDNYNNKKLLLAEKVLENCSYFPFVSKDTTRTVNGESTVYNNNYKYSEIRAFLNGYDYVDSNNNINITHNAKGFLQKAFTTATIENIANTVVDNTAESTTVAGTDINKSTVYVCANTTDKIFLLSMKEVTIAEYGFEECDRHIGHIYGSIGSRKRITTDYAKTTGIYCNVELDSSLWWLRSPCYTGGDNVLNVCSKGSADWGYNLSNCMHIGVVPALSISF